MENWRVIEELEKMRQWDADAVCDTLNISAEELVEQFLDRALVWIKDNNE